MQPYNQTKLNTITHSTIFIVWPFLAFLLAMFSFERKSSKVIIFLFFVLYGLTFVLGNIGYDSFENAKFLRNIASQPSSEFLYILSGFYTYTTVLDFFLPLLLFVISRFTDSHYILFAVYASIFSYFYLKSINQIYFAEFTRNINYLILLGLFVSIVPISEINGFRYYAATWIFFYGAYRLIQSNENKYLIFPLLSIIFHFSFLSIFLVLLLFRALGNRDKLYFLLIVLSYIIPNLIQPILDYGINLIGLPSLIGKYEYYTNMEYVFFRMDQKEQLNWFLRFDFVLIFSVILLVYYKLRFKNTTILKNNLFSFSLLLFAFGNFVSNIPSFGRFFTVFELFVIALMIHATKYFQLKNVTLFTVFGLFVLLLNIAIKLRMASETINFNLFGPSIFLLLKEKTMYEVLF